MKSKLIIILILLLSLSFFTMPSSFRENFDPYYNHFWADEIEYEIKEYFKLLLDPLQIKKTIFIHSVFDFLPYTGKYTNFEDLHILFTGESRLGQHNLQNYYKVKLIMENTDLKSGIITHPYFIVNSYVYNYWPRYLTPRAPTKKTKFCAFVVSNENNPERNRFFEKLNLYKQVDSVGGKLNNTGIYAPRNDEKNGDYSYFNFLSDYKFMICFENNSKDNYFTEKLGNAYLGNTIPIYWGASNVRKWINLNAILHLNETATENEMDNLINRIIEIDNNDELYNQIYYQPLMYTIHDDLQIDKIREKINYVLTS